MYDTVLEYRGWLVEETSAHADRRLSPLAGLGAAEQGMRMISARLGLLVTLSYHNCVLLHSSMIPYCTVPVLVLSRVDLFSV